MRLSGLTATAAVMAMLPHAAHAVDLPIRKAGLWEIKMTVAGAQSPATTMQHCTDESTDKEMASGLGPVSKDMCSKNDVEKTATGYVTNSVCTIAGNTSTTRAEFTGDFNSAYTVNVSSQNAGAPAGKPRDSTISIDAKWMGACKSDQKAGDIVMPGGMKMNIKDLQALRGQKK